MASHRNPEADALRKEWGQALAAKREKSGMTQQQLATHAGIATSTLVSYELGRRMPGVETLLDLARVLEVDAADLLPRVKPAKRQAR
jgi:transcriptional regulator with XRE-family HTH domain